MSSARCRTTPRASSTRLIAVGSCGASESTAFMGRGCGCTRAPRRRRATGSLSRRPTWRWRRVWASLLPRPDVVFATSPPLPVGAVGSLVAKRHRVPWVLDVRDLWPEAAVAVGELGSGRAFAFAERLERFLYRDAAAITTVTAAVRRRTSQQRLGSDERVELVPNGTTEFWVDAGAAEPDRSAAALPDDRFVWTFAGNVGLAQGLRSADRCRRSARRGLQAGRSRRWSREAAA